MNMHGTRIQVIRYVDCGCSIMKDCSQKGFVAFPNWRCWITASNRRGMVWSTSFSGGKSGCWTCNPTSAWLWSNNILWWKVFSKYHFHYFFPLLQSLKIVNAVMLFVGQWPWESSIISYTTGCYPVSCFNFFYFEIFHFIIWALFMSVMSICLVRPKLIFQCGSWGGTVGEIVTMSIFTKNNWLLNNKALQSTSREKALQSTYSDISFIKDYRKYRIMFQHNIKES